MMESTILDQVGPTLHLVRVTPSQMQVLKQAATHHVPFLQHPDWQNKSLLEHHLRKAATTAGRQQPTDGAPSNLPLTESPAGNGAAVSFDWSQDL